MIIPLDRAEGWHYTERVRDYESDDHLDCIYKIKAGDKDWLNASVDGWITWKRESSCTSDSDEEIER